MRCLIFEPTSYCRFASQDQTPSSLFSLKVKIKSGKRRGEENKTEKVKKINKMEIKGKHFFCDLKG